MVIIMDLRHLRYFVAVAEERPITRAARRLGIKQPPLSLQIRQLEQEVGTPLLHRLTRGVELTEAGALLLEEARKPAFKAGLAAKRDVSVSASQGRRISIREYRNSSRPFAGAIRT